MTPTLPERRYATKNGGVILIRCTREVYRGLKAEHRRGRKR